jgi:hypothetical protein
MECGMSPDEPWLMEMAGAGGYVPVVKLAGSVLVVVAIQVVYFLPPFSSDLRLMKYLRRLDRINMCVALEEGDACPRMPSLGDLEVLEAVVEYSRMHTSFLRCCVDTGGGVHKLRSDFNFVV